MRIFGVTEAEHYCSSFKALPGGAKGSIKTFVRRHLNGRHTLIEGSTKFDEYRDCALRDVDRCLFLAASHYRRALDLMIPSASSWAHVTLYYGSFLAATALLGMFGGWVDDPTVIEVDNGTPRTQRLTINRGGGHVSAHKGSHKRFWDLFYSAVSSLVLLVDPPLRFGIEPVGGSITWQIDNRNAVNYDSFVACELGHALQTGFNPAMYRATLPGVLNTQFKAFETLLLVAFRFAQQFGFQTDALARFAPVGARGIKIEQLVYDSAPPALNHIDTRAATLI